LNGGAIHLRLPGCTLGVSTPSAHLTAGLSARATEHDYHNLAIVNLLQTSWVLQGFSPDSSLQNRPCDHFCLGLLAVLTASRLYSRIGSVASVARNPLPSCTSLFRVFHHCPVGHRYRHLPLLPFSQLQGILPWLVVFQMLPPELYPPEVHPSGISPCPELLPHFCGTPFLPLHLRARLQGFDSH
jgi:hypothetical protein